jgi:hypothetical protein
MKRVLMGLAAIAVITFAPQTTSAQTGADLTLVHGIPGVTVDVAVDGTVVIDNFLPGSLANISSFAGQTLTNLTVTNDATGDVVIGPIAQLVVPTSGSHSIVAHLDAAGAPVLSTFENNTADTTTGDARLTVRHTAAAPAVDLIVGTDRPIEGATNGQSAELELPAGALAGAQLAPTGGAAIATVATLDLAADTNTIVYVVGSTTDATIDFVVQVVDLAAGAATTTTVASGATTTTTSAVPTAVNTGSPLGSTSTVTLIAIAIGGLTLAGGAMVARRRL